VKTFESWNIADRQTYRQTRLQTIPRRICGWAQYSQRTYRFASKMCKGIAYSKQTHTRNRL